VGLKFLELKFTRLKLSINYTIATEALADVS